MLPCVVFGAGTSVCLVNSPFWSNAGGEKVFPTPPRPIWEDLFGEDDVDVAQWEVGGDDDVLVAHWVVGE
jgi:hypothetical protein